MKKGKLKNLGRADSFIYEFQAINLANEVYIKLQ